MSKVRFTAFADLHHHPAWFKTDAPERLTAIQRRAEASGSDFIIHMGDLCHKVSASQELIDQYHCFRIPGYHVTGNHEFDLASTEEVLRAYRLESGYYYFDCNGFRFVILDENYFMDFPGRFFHYSERNYFDHPDGRDWMPPEEVDWFRRTVLGSPYPCVVCSHATIERSKGGIRNHDELWEIIRASQKLPGRVLLCINGHYHRDNFTVIENVGFLDMNSASADWVGTPHHLYPEEWYARYEEIGNQILFTDALSAVVTLDTNGTIDVEGMESSFVNGVSREMTDNPPGYRPCTPRVSSAHVKL